VVMDLLGNYSTHSQEATWQRSENVWTTNTHLKLRSIFL
jgi:hypothetical protein